MISCCGIVVMKTRKGTHGYKTGQMVWLVNDYCVTNKLKKTDCFGKVRENSGLKKGFITVEVYDKDWTVRQMKRDQEAQRKDCP